MSRNCNNLRLTEREFGQTQQNRRQWYQCCKKMRTYETAINFGLDYDEIDYSPYSYPLADVRMHCGQENQQ